MLEDVFCCFLGLRASLASGYSNYLCSYLSVFLLFLLSQVSSSSTSERANNHQSENSLQNIDSEIVLGWMKILSVIIGQENMLQKYNIGEERLRKQELLNPKK